ncbi:hypothetical protein XccvBFoX7_gp10 [Xanthomonas phage FoX7]|uniref:Uncharacterized protein n=2 Tax=Carpasinavirus XcP1 TaxID=2182344 RepID=A0A858NPV4_9CAUD|nr:hypothetical protein XccvBFoX6_gp10 [Xanthomonas phage FoX6]QJB22167.1 hypothetical protein XccvBFoX7_gp10 [Xanthomonas phage FoX7]
MSGCNWLNIKYLVVILFCIFRLPTISLARILTPEQCQWTHNAKRA